MKSCMQPHAPAEVQQGGPRQSPGGLHVLALHPPPLPLELPDVDPDMAPEEPVEHAPVWHVPPTIVQF